MIRVIGVNGSSRKDGNTAILIRTVLERLERKGIETQLIQLAHRELQGCAGCFACRGEGRCTALSDDFNECFERLCAADGLVLGTPVYSADVSARMKAFLERAGVVVASNPGLLRRKAGAGVAAVRRGGGLTAVDTLNHFLLNKEMLVVGSTYWNMVYGKDPGDVQNDAEGMANMRNLGDNMAWLLARLAGDSKK